MIIYMYISRKHMQKKEIPIKSFVRIHWSVSEMDRQHPIITEIPVTQNYVPRPL